MMGHLVYVQTSGIVAENDMEELNTFSISPRFIWIFGKPDCTAPKWSNDLVSVNLM